MTHATDKYNTVCPSRFLGRSSSSQQIYLKCGLHSTPVGMRTVCLPNRQTYHSSSRPTQHTRHTRYQVSGTEYGLPNRSVGRSTSTFNSTDMLPHRSVGRSTIGLPHRRLKNGLANTTLGINVSIVWSSNECINGYNISVQE